MKTKEEIQKELYDKYGFECGDRSEERLNSSHQD